MNKSFKEFMDEFERKGKIHVRTMAEKRRKDAERKKLEKGTPELPEQSGRIYDSRNEQDRKDAIDNLEKGKMTIRDIRQLKQHS
jgi:hypothetical protein